MIDFKKLITGFLILAALASSLVFMLSGIIGDSTQVPQAAQVAQVSANDSRTQPQVSQNAFVEPLSDTQNGSAAPNGSQAVNANDNLPPIVPTSNLTQNAAQIMAHELVATNPTGPQDAGDGNQTITQPDVDAVVSKISGGIGSKKIAIPDWGAYSDPQNIPVIQNATLSDEMKYEAALQDIYDKNLAQLNLTNPIDAASLNSSIDQISPSINSAFNETKAVPVPEQFVALHKSGLTLLSYAKNLLALGANANDDPLKSYIVLQAQEKNYAAAAAEFSSQMQKAFPLSDVAPSKGSSIIAELFGVQTAHAQYIDISALAQRPILQILAQIFNTLTEALLQILKNTIISAFENDTLNWIRNGGNPFAVTNWKSLLIDAGKQAVGAAIQQIAPGFCSSFGPLLRLSLTSPPGFNGSNFSSCTLDQVVANVRGFYQNFETGGWIAYGTMLSGDNNYFGAMIDGHDFAVKQQDDAQQAVQNEGVSSRGFLSVKKCPAGDTQASGGECYNPGTGYYDNSVVTTPGGAVADTIAKALGAKPDTINNATSITGILLTFAASVVNALVAKGASLL